MPRLRIVGSADVVALKGTPKRNYGNNAGLALNRAYCVAGELQAALTEQSVDVDTVVTVRGPNEQTAATADRSVEIRLMR